MPNQDQIDSLTRTALKIIGGILAAHGGQQMAALINTPDVVQLVVGVIVTAIGVYASHTTHGVNPAPPAPPATAPSAPKPVSP